MLQPQQRVNYQLLTQTLIATQRFLLNLCGYITPSNHKKNHFRKVGRKTASLILRSPLRYLDDS